MDQMIGGEVVLIDIVIYFAISLAWYGLLDLFARKKLGGSATPGYQALRFPKFISLTVVSAVSLILGIFFMGGLTVKASTATYFGVPYFAMWVFYLVCVLRRLRAERSGNHL